jgi:hypothetical protein
MMRSVKRPAGPALSPLSLAMALMLAGCTGAVPPAPVLPVEQGLPGWTVEAEAGDAASVRAIGKTIDIDTPEGLSLWWNAPIDGPVAIEYDVMAVSEGGPNDAVSDVNAFWMATDPAAPGGSPLLYGRSGAFADYDTLQTYYVGIGGNRNGTTRMRRYVGEAGNRPILPQHDRSDPDALLQPNRWTSVRLTADGGTVTVAYDGKPLFTMQDDQPYESGWFAIRTTKSHLRIRNVRITPLAD